MELQQQKLNKPVAKAAIYARYSSDMQSPSSADDQIFRIKHYVQKGNITAVKFPPSQYSLEIQDEWIIKDEAETGKVAAREGYQRVLHGIRAGKFQVLFVDDLSRLTRSLGNQLSLYDLLKFHGIELISLCDGISSESSNAKLVFSVKGIVNDIGNDGHALRTKRGQEARILKGYSAGDTCYGYGSRPTQIRISGGREVPSHYEIHINPEQAEVVKKIFDLKLKGFGFSAIAKYLNEKLIPSTDRGRKITGKSQNWSSTAVRKILMREKYVGIWRWGKTSRLRDPDANKIVAKDQPQNLWVEHNEGKEIRDDLIIVPHDKWVAVQKMIAQTTAMYREKKDKVATMNEARTVALRSGTLLAGILKCSECGGPLLQITGNRGGYYGCFVHHRKDETKCGNNRLLSRKRVEEKFVTALRTILMNPQHLEMATKMLNDMIKRRMKAAPEEIAGLEKKKSESTKEIGNLIKFVMAHGDISHTIKETLAQKEEESRYIDQRIKALKIINADRLLVTPYSLKAKYEGLAERLQKDPIIANGVLKPLFPQGLTCSAANSASAKNGNQHNSLWQIKGTLAVAAASGFSQLELGGYDAYSLKSTTYLAWIPKSIHGFYSTIRRAHR